MLDILFIFLVILVSEIAIISKFTFAALSILDHENSC